MGFHSIRHLSAPTLYVMGQPVSIIQMVLRHKSLNTTVQYLKILDLEETRDVLDAFAKRLSRKLTANGNDKRPTAII